MMKYTQVKFRIYEAYSANINGTVSLKPSAIRGDFESQDEAFAELQMSRNTEVSKEYIVLPVITVRY